MGIVIRQGFKGALVNYVGICLGAFNLLYLFPKLLSPQEIGLTRVLSDIALMLAGVAQLGTSGIVDRFFPAFRSDELKHKGFLILILLYPLVGFAIVVTLFLLLKTFWLDLFLSRAPLLVGYYYYLIPFIFFTIYLYVLESYSRAHLRIVVPFFFKEIVLRILLSLAVVLYFFKLLTIDGLVVALVFSYFLCALGMLFYIKHLKRFYLSSFNFRENKNTIKKVLYFSLVSVSSGTLGLVASKIDVILLSSKIGLRATGIYAIAFYIGTVIEIPRRAISQITVPIISGLWQANNMLAMNHLYKRVAANQFIAGMIMFLIVWCNVDEFISLIPNSSDYQAGKFVILYIGLARLVDMLTGINAEIINTSPYFAINFWLTLVSSVITIGLNQILIPLLGIEGAAVSTLIGYSLFNFIKIGYIYNKVKIQPFTSNTIYILLLGCISYLLSNAVVNNLPEGWHPIVKIATNSSVIAIAFLMPVYMLKLSPEIRALVDKALLRLR